MTQISPKSADKTNTNGHNSNSPINGYVGGHTNVSRLELIPDTNTLKSAPLPSPKPQQKSRSVPLWRRLFPGWGNVSIRTKLALLLMSGAAVPVIGVTQGLVWFSQQSAQETLEATLRSQASGFVSDYILWLEGESEAQAYSIAETVEATRINLQNPKLVELNRPLLQSLVSENPQERLHRPDASKGLRIITDTQGKIVAQHIQIHADYPLGSDPKSEEIIQTVSLPTGINLGDVPIIKDALQSERSLKGVELLSGKVMQRLGLDKQANIPLRSQSTQGLSESEQPFPEGTYPDIDQGKAALVAMAVQPIKVQGKVVGFAVVGALLNQHHSLVDTFGEIYNSATSIFAQDLQVATNVPYGNSKTRAIGTRAPREVAEVVLNRGQEFFDQTNIQGQKYLTAYGPLYDHQKELNPTGAKPVGMVFVGITPETVKGSVDRLQAIGYSIGGGILLLAGLVAIPVAGSFSHPIRRLAGFAQQVGEGKQGVRLETTSRQDEIGILSQELNKMATSIEANLEAERQEAERSRFLVDIASSRVRDAQELESVFNKALTGARETINADRVVIYHLNSDGSGYIAAESLVSGFAAALEKKINDPCIGKELLEAYKKGRVVATNNVWETNYSPQHMKLLERLQIKASVVTPIVSNDQLFGLLIAHHCSAPYAWQQSEINFLTQLAAQLGLILESVTLLEQQRTAKEQLQQRALDLLMQVEPISKGDLTIRASVTADEIGTIADSYNATVRNLRKIVTQVQAASTQVATTTSSNEVSVQELSAEALRQAQEITAALDRIQEMSNSIRAVATSAQQAEAAVQQATQTVKVGDAAMNRTVEGMLAIRETVAETSTKVQRLGESSQKISKVVNLIGTFAAQTNLLALKASIEAARAGEEGRGFAVLADEVRTLARQSQAATAEIETLVATIQTETNEVVAAMQAGTLQVAEGTKLVDDTRKSLNQITTVSAEIGALVSVIASSAATQSQDSVAVTQAMTDVAAIAQRTSTTATVVSASFEELLEVATQLQANVDQFKVS